MDAAAETWQMNQIPKNDNKRDKVPLIELCVSLFFVFIAVTWFIRAEVILPNKGIFLYGVQARLASAILMIVSAYPFFQQIGMLRAQGKHGVFLVLSALTACGIIGCVALIYSWPTIFWFMVPVLFLWGVIYGVSSSLQEMQLKTKSGDDTKQS